MVKSFLTRSSRATQKLAQDLIKKILKQKKRQAIVIGLIGDLGSGKTTFCQGLAKGLGIKEKILSPTFVIFRKFKIQNSKFKILYHFDCYRIEKPKEILKIGFKKIIAQPENIVVIEWAERIKKVLPRQTIILYFALLAKNLRKITLKTKFMLK